jgi:hypothetical protein
MKEFIGVSRNIYFAYDDESKTLHPGCEMIIIVSEPVPIVNSDGEIAAERHLEHLRFAVDPGGLVMLGTYCAEALKQIKGIRAGQEKETADA